MRPTVRIRDTEFQTALRQLHRALPRVAIPQILNQAGLDVSGRAFDNLSPRDVSSARNRLRAFLGQQLAQKVRVAVSGKSKGKFIKSGRKGNQLIRANLLANYWRGFRGKKGLYGTAMKKYSGRLRQSRAVGVGFLKSVFLPIIRALNPLVKYKFPFSRTRHISRWPGSRGDGIAKPAQAGWNPKTILNISVTPRNPSQEGKVLVMYTVAIHEAFAWKAGKMRREAERVLQAEFNKVNTRPL